MSAFFHACWRGKWIISVSVVSAIILAAIYSLYLPDVYRAEVVAAPTEEAQGGGLGQLAGQFGGLASLAGVNVGQGQTDKATQALEILQSRRFLSEFIAKHDIAVPLMAATGWNATSNELLLNDRIYSASSNEWVRKPSANQQAEPSAWELANVFREQVVSVQQEQRTGIIRIGVEFYSPFLAQEWATALLADLNEVMRERDVTEAEQSIRYLEERSGTTALASMQQVFSQLIEKQMQTMMLAHARVEYIYTTLSPALVPETAVKPRRAVIVILFALFGIALGILISLVRFGAVAGKKISNEKINS